MKKKMLVSIMVGTMLVSLLGACGTQDTVGSNVTTEQTENQSTEQAENQGQENVEVTDTQNEDLTETVRLETGHFYYDENAEVIKSAETEYDVYGNAVNIRVFEDRAKTVGVEYLDESVEVIKDEEMLLEYKYNDCYVTQCVAGGGDFSYIYERVYDEENNLIKESVYYDGNLLYEYVFQYDAQGNLICKEQIADGVIEHKLEWAYDEYNNMTRYSIYNYSNGECTTVYTTEYVYDDNGNLVKKFAYADDGNTADAAASGAIDSFNDWEQYEYDANGNQIKVEYCSNNGYVESWKIMEYDQYGNMIETTRYESDGTIMWKYGYEYDANGNIIKEIDYDRDGNIHNVYQCRNDYDSSGNRISYIEYDSDGNVKFQEEWKYDETRNVIEYVIYEKGIICEMTEWKYEEDGSIIETYTKYQDGILYEKIEYITITVKTAPEPIDIIPRFIYG